MPFYKSPYILGADQVTDDLIALAGGKGRFGLKIREYQSQEIRQYLLMRKVRVGRNTHKCRLPGNIPDRLPVLQPIFPDKYLFHQIRGRLPCRLGNRPNLKLESVPPLNNFVRNQGFERLL